MFATFGLRNHSLLVVRQRSSDHTRLLSAIDTLGSFCYRGGEKETEEVRDKTRQKIGKMTKKKPAEVIAF